MSAFCVQLEQRLQANLQRIRAPVSAAKLEAIQPLDQPVLVVLQARSRSLDRVPALTAKKGPLPLLSLRTAPYVLQEATRSLSLQNALSAAQEPTHPQDQEFARTAQQGHFHYQATQFARPAVEALTQ